MFTYSIYGISLLLLILSYAKDRAKTRAALKKAWKSFENIMPQFLAVILLIGLSLAFIDESVISKLLGDESGILGLVIAATVGSITLIPGFIAFPLAASLLRAGAGYGQITMFITTLMMVGVVTMPVETQYFGRETTIKRNAFAFIYAIAASIVIAKVL